MLIDDCLTLTDFKDCSKIFHTNKVLHKKFSEISDIYKERYGLDVFNNRMLEHKYVRKIVSSICTKSDFNIASHVSDVQLCVKSYICRQEQLFLILYCVSF